MTFSLTSLLNSLTAAKTDCFAAPPQKVDTSLKISRLTLNTVVCISRVVGESSIRVFIKDLISAEGKCVKSGDLQLMCIR